MWGLRQDEVSGRHFASLDIGLPVHRLLPVVRACAAGESADGELVLDAVNRRGRAIQCHVTCRPLKQGNDGTRGVILLMTEVEIGHGVTQ